MNSPLLTQIKRYITGNRSEAGTPASDNNGRKMATTAAKIKEEKTVAPGPEFLTTRAGETLPRSVQEYDSARPYLADRKLRAVCYAPFLSMDFDATGAVRLCNHSHREVEKVTPERSVLDIWRGAVYERYRKDFSNYCLDDQNCPHCVRQVRGDAGRNVFATQQFDEWADDDRNPPYPKRLIFRLHNACNLACIMCDGFTSSRIRKERDKRPNPPSCYGPTFFKDMRKIIPHAEHVEFYGGEPFLVHDHIKIFDIIKETQSKCTIYINTNGVSVTPRARVFLEELNIIYIAVSMDAVSDELHADVRRGMNNQLFMKNMAYFLDLRERRGVNVMLNVTEHRKNWFELPEIFRFAEQRHQYLHINTCIHPHNVTLYTLPSKQLEYVLNFFRGQLRVLNADYWYRFRNQGSFEFLINLCETELRQRSPDWQPEISNRNVATDGWLAAPRPGLKPFDTPEKIADEANRIVEQVGGEMAARMLSEILMRMSKLDPPTWQATAQTLQERMRSLPEFDPTATFQ